MNLASELEKLQELHRSGAINDDEYTLAKAKLLSQAPHAEPVFPSSPPTGLNPPSLEQQTRQWAFFLHLSVLAGFVVPLAGLIVPIVIWQLKKADLPGIDQHGKNAANWIVSGIIYGVGCVLLFFVIIGIPLLVGLLVLSIVFPIIAAIKANNGEIWAYPLAITFFS
jgi:uncharacterized Tic20 family protein